MMPPKSFLVDQLVCSLIACYGLAVLLARWHEYPALQRGILALIVPYSLALACLPRVAGKWYGKYRTPLILFTKGLTLLVRVDGRPLAHLQARLNQAPAGNLALDLFAAFSGLRMFLVMFGALARMRWSIWVLHQLVVIVGVANWEQDCKTPLLSHPLMAGRIASFHQWMHAIVGTWLPQADFLAPKTQLGACQAVVCFWAILLTLLLPALIIVRPPTAGAQPAHADSQRSWLRKVDDRIERGLWVLRGHQGHTLRGWLVVVGLLWQATAAAF